ncbi:MAG: ATP-dependent DNA ligase [Candidatus Aenigmatarchaeota archaeon]
MGKEVNIMHYSVLVEVYENLEKESSKLKKTEILAELFNKTPTSILPTVVLLSSGKIFPYQSDENLGIADKMIIRILARTTGLSEEEIIKNFKKSGDLGLVAEKCIKDKKQFSLMKKELTIELVFENLKKLSQIEGKGSQDRKTDLISQLLVSASPKEAKYIVRTILGTLRIGVAEGIVRDAISKSFGVDKKIVENAWFLLPDYGEIARISKEEGEEGLKKVRLVVGNPYVVMLGESSPSLKDALEKYEEVIIEYKYDGIRIEIHKKGKEIKLFTRRLENVTNQFPDLVELSQKGIECDECIVEGELVGVDPKTNDEIPFQELSKRIQRKYEIEEMMKKIPIRMYLFDLVYIKGRSLLNEPYKIRRKELEKIIKVIPEKFMLSKSLMTKNLKEADKFYKEACKEQEGVMVKNLNAKYQPGRRVGQWLKVKPILEPLDLVIIGAEWGTGKRSKWFGSFTLACLREHGTKEYLSCGRLGTGLSDEQFKELTRKLKGLIIEEKGREVRLEPKVIVEVGYEEIQKSPKYDSGYALRFPRLLRFRDDKDGPDEFKRLEYLFNQQFNSKKKKI